MKTKYLLMVAALSLLMAACSNSDDLTAGKAKELLNDKIEELGENKFVMNFKTGYFELNNNASRYRLRQLAANELITYSVQQVKDTLIEKSWYSTYQKPIVAYFVSVELTKKGQKLITKAPEGKDEFDFTNPNREKEYPESNVPEVDFSDDETDGSSNASSKYEDSSSSKVEINPANGPYALAKKKETTQDNIVLLGKIFVKKVCYIQVDKEDKTAQAITVLELEDVTPFGRIYEDMYNGDKRKGKAMFKYYADKGWASVNL